VYAFRFLRAALSLELGGHHDIMAAIDNLTKTNTLAESRGDCAILVVSHTLEAMVHLRSLTSDNVEQTQRAVAAARTYQLQSSVKNLTQIWALLDCIDLACSLSEYHHDQQGRKAEVMQKMMDDAIGSEAWRMDGQFAVPLESSPSSLTDSTCGIFERTNGKDHLMFSWLRSRDLWALCYLLSGIAASKGGVERKAAHLTEGLKIVKGRSNHFIISNICANHQQTTLIPQVSKHRSSHLTRNHSPLQKSASSGGARWIGTLICSLHFSSAAAVTGRLLNYISMRQSRLA
jgi:hypothetical protein